MEQKSNLPKAQVLTESNTIIMPDLHCAKPENHRSSIIEAWHEFNVAKDFSGAVRALNMRHLFPRNVMVADTSGISDREGGMLTKSSGTGRCPCFYIAGDPGVLLECRKSRWYHNRVAGTAYFTSIGAHGTSDWPLWGWRIFGARRWQAKPNLMGVEQ